MNWRSRQLPDPCPTWMSRCCCRHGDSKPLTVRERDIANVVGHSASGSGLVRYGRSRRQQSLEPANAGARARYMTPSRNASLSALIAVPPSMARQQFQHRKGRCVVAGFRLEVQIAISLLCHQCRVVFEVSAATSGVAGPGKP